MTVNADTVKGSPLRRWIPRLLLFLWIFLIVGAAASPGFRAGMLMAVGRNFGCPRQAAWQAAHNVSWQEEAAGKLAKAARIIRTEGDLALWELPGQERFWVPRESKTLTEMRAEQVRRIYGSGGDSVHPGDVVLDCGANIGLFAKTALADGASRVIEIEPAPDNLRCLRRNLAAEIQQGRVVIYPKGVWDKDDVLTLRVQDHNSGGDSVAPVYGESREGQKVPLTTIDRLVAELGLPKVDFIKMDIEGSERPALLGARATLARFHPRMAIAMEHRPDDPVEIPRLIRAMVPGYNVKCGPCLETGASLRPETLLFF